MKNKTAIMKNKNLIYLILGLICVAIVIVLVVTRGVERPKEKIGPPEQVTIPLAETITPPMPDTEPQKIMKWNNPPEIIIDRNANYTAVLSTNKGDIEIELFARENSITVNNFVFLAQQGFYKGIIFHRIINGFMIQAGCPYGTGMGGPGYVIPDEFRPENKNDKGTISMANAGPNTGGSQFFINLVDNNFLDTRHPVFGKVIKGMDIVDAIGRVQTRPGDRPFEDIVIKTIEITKQGR